MSIKERDVVLVSTNENNDTIIDMPVTRENCVEGLGRIRGTAYSVGDVALCAGSQSLQLICTASGTTSINELDISANTEGDTITDGTVVWKVMKRNYLGKVEPIGTIFAFAGNDIPSGYLPCNGSAISRETYADLFAVIGTTYGSGDGSTTFNLPNLTDKFIQGSDTVGTVKSAGLPNITGTFESFSVNGYSGAIFRNYQDYTSKNDGTYDKYIFGYGFDASKSNAIYGNSTTVQPPALTMRYIIKY